LERKRVVVSEYIDPAGLELLRRETEVLFLPDMPGTTLEDAVAGAHGLGVRLARPAIKWADSSSISTPNIPALLSMMLLISSGR